MTLRMINASIVTIGNGYNPIVLHPAFLQSRKVVPQRWEIPQKTLSTPLLSVVDFQNGMVFLAETEKLQVQDARQGTKPSESLIKIAGKFLDQFPGVIHRAVGFNPMCIIEQPEGDGEKVLIEKFLKSGVWNRGDLTLKGVAVTLLYELEHANLRLVCDTGEAKLLGETHSRRGLILNANYNTDIPQDLSSGDMLIKVKEAISQSTEYYKHFQATVELLFSELIDND